MNGILLIDKEKNVTSRDVVNDLVHIFNTKQIGHTGTLDPIATGVLVITIGKFTKLGDALMSTYKEYIATMELGYLTDTLDITGNILNKSDKVVSEDKIKEVINSFKKTYMQEVPIYSSVKVNGRKLYDYARNNEEVELPKKEVEIKDIEILSINNNVVKFRTLVSKGTYIRSLIRDIGESLGTYATMSDLKRTKQGKFNIEDCYKVEDVKNNNYRILDITDVLDIEVVECDESLFKYINNGVRLDKNYQKEYVLFKYKEKDICLYHYNNNQYEMFLKY